MHKCFDKDAFHRNNNAWWTTILEKLRPRYIAITGRLSFIYDGTLNGNVPLVVFNDIY